VATWPSGDAPGCSRSPGDALLGSRANATRVAVSGATRHVERNAPASRVESPCRSHASPSRRCSPAPNSHSASAVESDSRPQSSRTPISGASCLASVSRRSTQCFFLPSNFPIAAGDILSSSRSDATTRASSIGLAVFPGEFAARSRAFRSIPDTSSTTTGISLRPSPFHRASRLKPSRTS